jgi:hypothetical protein
VEDLAQVDKKAGGNLVGSSWDNDCPDDEERAFVNFFD